MKLTGERLLDAGWDEEVSVEFFWYQKNIGKLAIYVRIPIVGEYLDYKDSILIEVKDWSKLRPLSSLPHCKSIYKGKIHSMGQFNNLVKMMIR